MSVEIVNIRCPGNLRKLFAKMQLSGESPRMLQPGNLLMVACYDCSKEFKNSSEYKGGRVRILHHYSFVGELIESSVEYIDDRS